MKITIQLDEQDIEEILILLEEYPELLQKLSESYRFRYSSPSKVDTD